MQIAQAMTKNVETIPSGTSVVDAAGRMKQLEAGFLPVTDRDEERMIGIATDRDIVVRCVAEGRDPARTPIDEAISERVLYCFADETLESAAKSMARKQVYRLVVLDEPDSKRLVGIISLSDIRRHGGDEVAEQAIERIVEAA